MKVGDNQLVLSYIHLYPLPTNPFPRPLSSSQSLSFGPQAIPTIPAQAVLLQVRSSCHSTLPPKQTPSSSLKNMGLTRCQATSSIPLLLLPKAWTFSHLLNSLLLQLSHHAFGYALLSAQNACFCPHAENASSFKAHLQCLLFLLPIVSEVGP